MENNGFEKYSKAWNSADNLADTPKVYSEKEIHSIKMKTSLDFSRTIHNSIKFDFIHKGILILGMMLLMYFFNSNITLVILLSFLIILSSVMLYREKIIQKHLKKIDDYSNELGEVIKRKLAFYKSGFNTLKLMLAFTNALLVWVGSMFYYYSKYGYYKMDDFGDIVVTITMLGLAYLISYFALTWQLKNNVLELEESLNDLDEHQAEILHGQLKRKKRNKMIMLVLAAAGVFLFVVLVLIYLRQLI